jgi:hypothetical protein
VWPTLSLRPLVFQVNRSARRDSSAVRGGAGRLHNTLQHPLPKREGTAACFGRGPLVHPARPCIRTDCSLPRPRGERATAARGVSHQRASRQRRPQARQSSTRGPGLWTKLKSSGPTRMRFPGIQTSSGARRQAKAKRRVPQSLASPTRRMHMSRKRSSRRCFASSEALGSHPVSRPRPPRLEDIPASTGRRPAGKTLIQLREECS